MNNGRRGGYLAAVIAVVALAGLTLVATVAAKPEKVVVGNLEVEYDGGFSPKALPKNKLTPISFFLWSKLKTVDGKHPPAIKEFKLEGDKNVVVDVKGVPTCTSGKLQSQTSAAARKVCGPAIVGSGTTEVEVQFPEQPPIDVKSELLAFNGGFRGGVTTLYIHAYLTAPVTAADRHHGEDQESEERPLRNRIDCLGPEDRRRLRLCHLLQTEVRQGHPLRQVPRRAPTGPRHRRLRRRHQSLGDGHPSLHPEGVGR